MDSPETPSQKFLKEHAVVETGFSNKTIHISKANFDEYTRLLKEEWVLEQVNSRVPEKIPPLIPYMLCLKPGCEDLAVADYNGQGYFLCETHLKEANNYFNEEYR